MKKSLQKKELKLQVFSEMLEIYLQGNQGSWDDEKYKRLMEGTRTRIRSCRSRASFCAKCDTKCFSPNDRELIRKVMAYSGRRIIFKRPLLIIKYLLATIV